MKRPCVISMLAKTTLPGYDEPSDFAHVPNDIKKLYEVHSWRNAATVLANAHRDEWQEVLTVLRAFRLRRSYVMKDRVDEGEGKSDASELGGGNKSLIAKALDGHFSELGWGETLFQTEVKVTAMRKRPGIKKAGKKRAKPIIEQVEDRRYAAPTHKVDCYKNRVALEVEWNNKDPFYDRDLNNFRLLFDLRVVDVGVIVTRSDDLDDFLNSKLPKRKAKKYSANTTHMKKLQPLLQGGSGGGCPTIVFGIKPKLYDPNH